MDQFATVDDLTDRWRSLTAEEQTRADVLLGSASRMIRRAFREAQADLTARLAAGDLDQDDLTDVACWVVKRAMLSDGNPVKQEQQQYTIGSLSTNVSRTYTNPTGDLYLTAADRATLGLTATSGRAFSISMIPRG